MTQRIAGIILLLITIVLIFFLSRPTESTPALGSFLSTSHGFWKNIDAKPLKNYEISIKGPVGESKVIYDERGVPHIFADNEDDLYFAQGYVMAKDRLWQMEFISYYASGRLSEIVGEKALELDRFNRRIGLKRAAQKTIETFEKDKASKAMLDQFAAGVNTWIRQLKKSDLPIEYKLLGYAPEEWQPINSALLLKYMAYDLTGFDDDIERTNALNLFGRALFDQMFPDFPDPLDPIIPVETPFDFTALSPTSRDSSTVTALYKNPTKAFAPPKGLGSNNWAVGGGKTASGMPLLCNDPHLALNLPSIWYEMQMSAPGVNVYGVTLPGSPGIVIGYNQHIAWGVTNAGMDVRDWYEVEINPNNLNQYKADGKWMTFEEIEEVYKVKGKEDFKETIRMTVAGPVVYDESFDSTNNRNGLVMNWMAHQASNELMTFHGLNRAKDHQDYLVALDHYWCPAQNFVYADIENNIAIKEQGRFWVRNKEQGRFIQKLSEANLEAMNSHFIPNDQNPYVLNPPRGFVSSANQIPVGKAYPYYILGEYENYRNRRINEVLTDLNNATIEDMKRLHYDNLSLLAKETLPYMLANYAPPIDKKGKEMYAALSKWDYFTEHTSNATSYFYKWWQYIEQLSWDEFKREDISLSKPENYTTARLLVTKPDFPLFDIQSTRQIETAKDIISIAFDSTITWFKANQDKDTFRFYKNTALTHMAKLLPFSIQNLPIGGYMNIVNATSSRWGASVRFVVDFSNGKVQGYGMYPGGQTGNPGSADYTAFADAWVKGQYYKHNFFTNLEDARKVITKK